MKRRSISLAVIGLIAVALVVLLWVPSLLWRLPYLDYWDERQTVTAAADMFTSGTLITSFFSYGSIPQFLALVGSIPALSWLGIRGLPINRQDLWVSTEYGWAPMYWEMVAFERLMWMLVALLAIGIFSHALVVLYGRLVGLTSGLLLLTVPMTVFFTTRISVDGLGMSISLLVMSTALLALSTHRPEYSVASAALVGLAVATKYTFVVLVIVLAVETWISNSDKSLARTAKVFLIKCSIAVVTFVLVSPAWVLNPREAARVAVYEVLRYQSLEGADAVEPGFGHLWVQIENLARETSVPFLALAVVGWIVMARTREGRRAMAIVVLPAIVMLAIVVFGRAAYHRNLILMYPALAVGFAWLLARIVGGGGQFTLRRLCFGTVVAVTALWPIGEHALEYAKTRFTRDDSRNVALEFALVYACNRGAHIVADSYLTLALPPAHRNCPGLQIENRRLSNTLQPHSVVLLRGMEGQRADTDGWRLLRTFGTLPTSDNSSPSPTGLVLDPQIEVWEYRMD